MVFRLRSLRPVLCALVMFSLRDKKVCHNSILSLNEASEPR